MSLDCVTAQQRSLVILKPLCRSDYSASVKHYVFQFFHLLTTRLTLTSYTGHPSSLVTSINYSKSAAIHSDAPVNPLTRLSYPLSSARLNFVARHDHLVSLAVWSAFLSHSSVVLPIHLFSRNPSHTKSQSWSRRQSFTIFSRSRQPLRKPSSKSK